MSAKFPYDCNKSIKFIGFVSAIIAVIIMGCFGVFVRNVTADEGLIALARFSLGFLFLTFYLLLSKKWRTLKVKISWSLFLSGIFLALCILFYSKAIKMTTLVNAAFLLYLAPLIASVLAYFFLKEKISVFKAVLIFLAFIGSLFLFEFNFSFSGIASRGKLFALASALCYALFIIANRMISSAISCYSRTFYQLLFGSLVLLPVAGRIDLTSHYYELYWLIAIGFFQGYVALSLMIFSLRYLHAYEYATVSYIEPLIAALAGYLIYTESLSLLQITGCFLILVCGLIQIRTSVQSTKQED